MFLSTDISVDFPAISENIQGTPRLINREFLFQLFFVLIS